MLNWSLKRFEELTPQELYDILQLRIAVFVVEQNCAYQEADGKDNQCHHLMGRDEESKLVAIARIVPPGLSFTEPAIGRVVSATEERGRGYGKELMTEAINRTEELYGKVDIRIGAQRYLLKFYGEFGFVREDDYVEDGIPHSHMLRKALG